MLSGESERVTVEGGEWGGEGEGEAGKEKQLFNDCTERALQNTTKYNLMSVCARRLVKLNFIVTSVQTDT